MTNSEEDQQVVDRFETARFLKAYGLLYVSSYLISGVHPFICAFCFTLATGILDGKLSRSDNPLYNQSVHLTSPVTIEITGLTIAGYNFGGPYTLPWRPYTTDIDNMLPNFATNAYTKGIEMWSDVINKMNNASTSKSTKEA